MDIYNKYIWIGVTNVHETLLETAGSPGCSASGEPADHSVLQHRFGSYNRLQHHKVLFPLPGWIVGRKKTKPKLFP